MAQNLASHVAALRTRWTAWTSNAWTRVAADPAAARRVAGLRYWDGDCVS
jgi:hypothetical protein